MSGGRGRGRGRGRGEGEGGGGRVKLFTLSLSRGDQTIIYLFVIFPRNKCMQSISILTSLQTIDNLKRAHVCNVIAAILV